MCFLAHGSQLVMWLTIPENYNGCQLVMCTITVHSVVFFSRTICEMIIKLDI